MAKINHFLLFTIVFCVLFGMVFITGYTRSTPAGQSLTNCSSSCGEMNCQEPMNRGACSNCTCEGE
ncbi:MAG TPA: hypothetical protein P5309_03310 [Syntrophomonadaceae bacterium]|jgi:hypothetical protein|nr:hypothetical protein [Syntrophomonadaceae bacterium]